MNEPSNTRGLKATRRQDKSKGKMAMKTRFLVLRHGRDALSTWDSIAYWERGTKGPGPGF